MHTISLWAYRGVLLLPAVFLSFVAAPRFLSGIAIDEAFPVPDYMMMDVDLPRSAYAAAAVTLALADDEDGQVWIQQAEATALSGASSGDVIPRLVKGLARSPTSARGWTLLAEQTTAQDPRRAAAALAMALYLGPYDFWLAGRRARTAAALWNTLSEEGRQAALRQVSLLWSEPLLNQEIRPVLTTRAGVELMTHALWNEPEQLRALNRWIASQRRKVSIEH